jgi:hypothetical protein
MRRLALLPVVLLTAGLSACSDEEGCSNVGCAAPLTLDVQRATWEAGLWEVELAFGDTDLRCTWNVPAPAPGTDPDRCRGSERPSFELGTETAEVTVSLVHDGVAAGTRVVRPHYTEYGDECLSCRSADEVVEF